MTDEPQTEFPLPQEWDGGLWVPAPVVRDRGLPYRTKLVAGVIHALARRDGYCRASNGRIAELFGTNPRTVKRDLALLVERGHAQIVGATRTRRIIPLYSHAQAAMTARGQTAPSESELGANRSPTRGQMAPHLGSTGPTQKKEKVKEKRKLSAIVDSVLLHFNIERKKHVRGARTLDTPTYRSKIRGRLGESWPEIDLLRAGRGAFASEYHKETGWRFLTPELVYRDTAHVERFLREAEQSVYTDRICGGCGKEFEAVKFIGEQAPRLCPHCTEIGGETDGEGGDVNVGGPDGEGLSRLQVQVPGMQ